MSLQHSHTTSTNCNTAMEQVTINLPPLTKSPPPPIKPPQVPVARNQPSHLIKPSKQMLPVATSNKLVSTSAAATAHVWKEEISSGIQKLQSWGKCNKDSDSVWITSNQHTSPILQQGPECGIVALCMALNILEPHASVLADRSKILQMAKEKGFTIQGEMFSAPNLLQLAYCVCKPHGEVLTGNMMNNLDDIIIHLANGWPALVPYDNDANFEPCCRRGHKVHWAVLTGFLLHCKRQNLPDLSQTGDMHQDLSIPYLYYINPPASSKLQANTAQTLRGFLDPLCKSDIYVLARQGKSTRVHPWSFCALADSNSNLAEVGDDIRRDSNMFVTPEGGIKVGLCGRVVLIRP